MRFRLRWRCYRRAQPHPIAEKPDRNEVAGRGEPHARHREARRVSLTELRAGSAGHVAQVLSHPGARRLGEDAPADDG
jgi:hypothetical protein